MQVEAQDADGDVGGQLIEDQVERLGLVGVRAILRRNLRLFASVLVAIMAIAALVLIFKERVYTAEAVIVLQDRKVTIRSDLRPIANLEVTPAEIMTEVEIIRSRNFARKVVENLGLVDDPSFNPAAGDATAPRDLQVAEATTKLLQSFVITPFRGTLGIGILAYDTDAARAALIANEIAQAYIQETVELQRLSVLEKVDLISARIAQADHQISETEVELSTLILEHDLDDDRLGDVLSAEIQNGMARLEFLSELDTAQDEVERLESDLAAVKLRLEQRLKSVQERKTLERQLEDLHARRELLYQRSSDLVVHEGLLSPLARQISEAQTPVVPTLPNRNTILVGSFVSALVIGFIAVLVREMLDSRLFIRRSVHPALGLQGALQVPRFPRATRSDMPQFLNLFAAKLPPDTRAEAVRHVFAVLMSRFAASAPTSFLITSSDENDRSAFTALCLAVSAAEEGLKTLIVDLDPQSHRTTGAVIPAETSQYGLPILLRNATLMAQEATELANGVEYIRPSTDFQIPVALLDQHGDRQVIAALDKLHDLILYNVPPVGENAALGRLLPLSRNVVFVVRDQASDTGEIARSIEKLRQLGIEPEKIVNLV